MQQPHKHVNFGSCFLYQYTVYINCMLQPLQIILFALPNFHIRFPRQFAY